MPRPASKSGVSKLASGKWRWRLMLGGVRYTGIADTEAAAKLARAEAEINAGGEVLVDPTVRELLERQTGIAGRAETTLANWRWALGHLPAPFLDRRVSTVTPPVVAALWRQLADAPPHRLIKTNNLCSTAWQDALKLGIVSVNPFRVITPPTPPRSAEIVPPAPADVAALIAAADPWFRVWLMIAAHTGARGGEICALEWRDVNLETGEILIRQSLTRTGATTATKTGVKGQRRVHLDDAELEALAEFKQTSRWVFDRGDGHPMRPDGAAKRLALLCRRLELDISPHDLRHFAVTQWLAAGASIPDVANLIGDNPKTVMQTYAHHIPGRGRDLVRQLAKIVRDA